MGVSGHEMSRLSGHSGSREFRPLTPPASLSHPMPPPLRQSRFWVGRYSITERFQTNELPSGGRDCREPGYSTGIYLSALRRERNVKVSHMLFLRSAYL